MSRVTLYKRTELRKNPIVLGQALSQYEDEEENNRARTIGAENLICGMCACAIIIALVLVALYYKIGSLDFLMDNVIASCLIIGGASIVFLLMYLIIVGSVRRAKVRDVRNTTFQYHKMTKRLLELEDETATADDESASEE